jgi:hypothetical protein
MLSILINKIKIETGDMKHYHPFLIRIKIMNEIYLTIMVMVVTITIILWSFHELLIDSFFGSFSILLSTIVSAMMLILSGAKPVGDDLIEIKPATNTIVGNQLIIQSKDYPTQVVSDIGLIDKKVQVKRVITQNAWGGDLETKYIVEPID